MGGKPQCATKAHKLFDRHESILFGVLSYSGQWQMVLREERAPTILSSLNRAQGRLRSVLCHCGVLHLEVASVLSQVPGIRE